MPPTAASKNFANRSDAASDVVVRSAVAAQATVDVDFEAALDRRMALGDVVAEKRNTPTRRATIT